MAYFFLASWCLCVLLFLSCSWFLVPWCYLWSGKVLDMISIFLNLLRLDLWPKIWSILEHIPSALEKNVYLMLLDGMFYKYQLSLSGLVCHLRPFFPYWFSVWMIYWYKWGVKVPHYCYVTINFSFYGCHHLSLYCGAPMLATYIFTVVLSCIDPLIII